MATFEVSVTPKWKKKVAVDPSPVLSLERFKGTPSLVFQDLKVGQLCTKGLWIRNSNECAVTVSITKLPPPERGVTFSEIEFNLDSLESKRVEVTWAPLSPGTWRDVVQVQVWGLPPPHLNYRVVLHFTSVEPKPKHKCCCVNPPLRARNARPSAARGGKAAAAVPGACTSCCKRNVKSIPLKSGAPKSGAAPSTVVAKGAGKENASRGPARGARLLIKAPRLSKACTTQQHSCAPQQKLSAMDEDSLEEDRAAETTTPPPLEPFVPMEEGGLLPPCSIPSTPIRRVTYSVRGGCHSLGSPGTPVNAANFMVSEEEQPGRLKEHDLRFMQIIEEIQFSPLTKVFDEPDLTVPKCSFGEVPSRSNSEWSLLPSPVHSSTRVEEKCFLNGAMQHQGNVVTGVKAVSSSPILSSMTKTSAPAPQCSPIPLNPVANTSVGGAWCASAGNACTEFDPKFDLAAVNDTYTMAQAMYLHEYHDESAVTTVKSNDPNAIIQQVRVEELARGKAKEEGFEKFEAMNRAACTFQKHWRRIQAKRETEKLRLDRLESMSKAAIVIQKNWRCILAKKRVSKLRANKFNAACILQKHWRRLLAIRLATKLKAEREMIDEINRATILLQRCWRQAIAKREARIFRVERIQEMNRAAVLIQRCWRQVIAKRQARIFRAERIQEMNRAAVLIQRCWRQVIAKRQARIFRAERIQEMNRAAILLQRCWRQVIAKRQARIFRAERIQEMNRAAILIQRCWRQVIAKRQARIFRAERIQEMNRAAILIQRCWRQVIAKRQARIFRAERIQEMNRAAILIQRCWRQVIAKRQARIFRAERIQEMNRAAILIQRCWRQVIAKRQARIFRAERIQEMNRAAILIQRCWREVIAKRQARIFRAERIQEMNRAACIFQKNWRCILAIRLAAKLKVERLESMNKAACLIQKNWRVVLAKRKASKLREERLNEMNKAACIIQKNWRRVLSQRLAAALRAEKANDYSTLRQEFALKVCSKFHVEMSQFDLMHKLISSLSLDQDVSHALKYMQSGLRSRMLPPFPLQQCSKATQTVDTRAEEFAKPKVVKSSMALRRRTMHEKVEAPKPSPAARKCLCIGAQRASFGAMSPIRRKVGQKEVPEAVRWSSVAEAVGCTPRK